MEFLHSDERILSVVHSTTQQFLTDYSPTDKPWDTNKAFNGEVSEILDSSDKREHQKQAKRMNDCADNLEFGWVLISNETGECKLRLKLAQFCRVRYCPICQWRRALMWISRFFDAFPKIYAEYPEMRYIMLTVTVRNCEIAELRATVDRMANAWNKLTKRKDYPAEGFVRSLEVTRGKDGSAHPHFHILIAVPPSYFNGRSYLSKDKWAELWGSAMKLDYKPVCDVRIVKERKSEPLEMAEGEQSNPMKGLMSAITETIKYTTKPADMVKDKAWLLEMVDQMRNVRAVSMGGIFKRFLKESEDNQDLITASEMENRIGNGGGLFFDWRKQIKRYVADEKKNSFY